MVTDFSFAFINAVTETWNGLKDLSIYLNLCYDSLVNDISLNVNVILKVCVCHLMKNIASDVNTCFTSENKTLKRTQRKLFKIAIASAFMISDLRSMEKWFLGLVLVATEPNHTVEVAAVVANINARVFDEAEYNFGQDFSCSNSSEEIFLTLYQKSKFHQHFLKFFETNDKSLNPTIVTNRNPYYMPKLISIILKKYIAYLPLWTNIITDNTRPRFSNAPVENHFNKIQNVVLTQKNLRCTRFIRYHRELVLGIHKQLSLDIPKKRCARDKKTTDNNKQIETDKNLTMDVEESWLKKRKRSTATYFGPSTKILKKDAIPTATTITNLTTKESTFYPNGNVKNLEYYDYKPFNYKVAFFSWGGIRVIRN